MARSAKPWYRKDRKAWFVTIGGVRHNLGSEKAEALRQFHALMREPQHKAVQSQSFVAVADAFLEWAKPMLTSCRNRRRKCRHSLDIIDYIYLRYVS